jgi:hypothetical protein
MQPGNPPPQTASYAVSLDNVAGNVNLLASTSFVVTVAPNGFKGMVALATMGLPSDVVASFDNSALTLDGASNATAKLTLTTATSTKPGPTSFSVVGESEAGSQSTSATLTVASQLVIHVPAGVDQNGGSQNNPVMDAFGGYPIMITAPANMSSTPVTIKFYNDDNVPHEIHASSPGAGFPHGNGPFDPQTFEGTRRNVTMKGTYDFYLHDQGGPSTVGRIVIQ